MINGTSVWVSLLIIGYLAVLTISLARWQGLRVALKEHTGSLLIILLLTLFFIESGGLKYLYLAVFFVVFCTIALTVLAGPMGFVVGLILGISLAIAFLLYSLII